MKLEHTDLPTMLDVANAMERGEKIEWICGGEWSAWSGGFWDKKCEYRSVREVPTKTKRFLGWINCFGRMELYTEDRCPPLIHERWIRFPQADCEYEVGE